LVVELISKQNHKTYINKILSMKKQILGLALVVTMIGAMASCSSSKKTDGSDSTTVKDTTKVVDSTKVVDTVKTDTTKKDTTKM